MSGLFYPMCRAILSVVFEGSATADLLIIPMIPDGATVVRNSYHQADTFSIDFDAKDLPIPPAAIVTGQVELYMYQTRGLVDPERNVDRGRVPTIIGLFDETSAEYDSESRVFHVDGTDFTSLYIGRQWDQRNAIPTGQPLSRILEQLIRDVDPPTSSNIPRGIMQLDYRPTSDPIVGRVGARVHKKKGMRSPANVKNYWDVISLLAVRHGFIAFVEGLRVVVTTPRARLSEQDPRLRKLAYGRSLESVSMRRRMGKERTPQIKVRAWDDENQRVVEAVFPEKGQKAKTGVGTEFDETQVYTSFGISDPAILKRQAETIYDLRARGEQQVVIKTGDLQDDDAGDMLDVRTGDPLFVSFDPFNTEEFRALKGESQREAYLLERGFKPAVARVMSQSVAALLAFRKPFRTFEAQYDWDAEEGGMDIEIELNEFVDVGISLDAERATIAQ